MVKSSAPLGLCLLAVGVLAADCVVADAPTGGSSGDLSQPLPQQPLQLTLKGALAAAVDNNPDVLLYRERIQEAKGQVRTQLGAMLPNLSANVRQTRQTQFLGTIGLSPVRTDPFSIFDARVTATQNLFSLSLIQRWRASRESLQMTEQEAEARKLDTMASVALAYMEGLKAAAMIKMHEVNQQVMNELLGTVRQRQRGGLATGLDIARLEAQLAAERQQGSSARYDLEHAKLSLVNLLALPTETALVLTDEWLTDVQDVLDAAGGGGSGIEPTARGSGTAHPCESFGVDLFLHYWGAVAVAGGSGRVWAHRQSLEQHTRHLQYGVDSSDPDH